MVHAEVWKEAHALYLVQCMHVKVITCIGPAKPVGQVRQMPDQYLGMFLYYSFIYYYHTSKTMKFILHMLKIDENIDEIKFILHILNINDIPQSMLFASAGPVTEV